MTTKDLIEKATTEVIIRKEIGRSVSIAERRATGNINRVANYLLGEECYTNGYTDPSATIMGMIKHVIENNTNVDHLFEIVTALDIFGASMGRTTWIYDVCKEVADKLSEIDNNVKYIKTSFLDLLDYNSKLLLEKDDPTAMVISTYVENKTGNMFMSMFTGNKVITHSDNELIDWMNLSPKEYSSQKFRLFNNVVLRVKAETKED